MFLNNHACLGGKGRRGEKRVRPLVHSPRREGDAAGLVGGHCVDCKGMGTDGEGWGL